MKLNHGHTAMLATNVLFGMNYALSKDLMDGTMSAVSLNAWRFLAGAVFFWALSPLKREKVSHKDLFILLIGAIVGLLMNQIFFIQGLSRTSPLDSSIIATSVPILTMVLSALFLKEPASWMKIIGVVVGASGAVFLVYTSQFDASGHSSLVGNLLCLLSCLSFAAFLIITKRVAERYSPVTLMKWMFLFAVVLYLPFTYKDLLTTRFVSFEQGDWFSWIFAMVGATILPYLLTPIGQKRLRPTTLAMYNYVQPITAGLLAVYMGQGAYTVSKGIAAGLVFLGVYIVTRSKSRAEIEAARENRSLPTDQRKG